MQEQKYQWHQENEKNVSLNFTEESVLERQRRKKLNMNAKCVKTAQNATDKNVSTTKSEQSAAGGPFL